MRKRTFKHKHIQGALVYLEFNLAIQADACNTYLYWDQLAVAQPLAHTTNEVTYGGNTHERAKRVEKFSSNHKLLSHIHGSRETTVIKVPSPDNPTQS